MKRALTTLTAALLSTAVAQEIATSLPMTSIGSKLMWTVGDQDLKLVVGLSSRVQLDVYGAQFDPQDYRGDDYYGDENYSTERPKAPVSSTFTLIDANGKVVREQNFGVGAQDWQTFLNADLPAGNYTLRVRTEGNGKNTFAFRLNSISAAVEAEHLNVTIRSNDWVPALNVVNPGGDMSIRMYDGDGAGELEAELRDAAGNVYPQKVSGQLQWDDIKVPAEKGNYTLYLRQPKGTFQYSNSVGFELSTGPIKVVVADTTGRLEVLAELVLPDEVLPTQATVTVGEQAYAVNGSVGPLTVPANDYPVKVEPIKGAAVTSDKETVTVVKKETAQVKVQVKPDVALSFSADKPEVCVGDVVTFTARASTDFERQTLPAQLRVKLPAGFTAAGETTATARIDASNPSVLTFEAKADAAGSGDFTATLLPWNKTQALGVKVLPTATQIELRRAPLAPTLAGEVVTVRLTVKNTSAAEAPYTLTDTPGETLEALDPVAFSGTLKPGEEQTLSYRARVRGDAGAEGQLSATLTSNCESSQTVGGVLGVQTPPPVVVAPTPVVSVARESTVRIPFDAPKAATQIVIAHQPPAESVYVPGTSTLSGKAIADPQTGPSGKFYWTTPGAATGVLTYRVTHEGSLPALASPTLIGKYAKDRLEVLVGDGQLDDLKALTSLTQSTVAAKENSGAVKLPLDGAVFRDRDRITITVQGNVNDRALPSVNGVPISAATLGKTVLDASGTTQRQEYFGIPLRTGENTISYGDQSVKVFLSGSPVAAQFTPQQLVADGITPLRVGIRLTDAAGVTTASSNVTVQADLEVTQGDSQPRVGSYQVKLTDGVGVLELEPLSAPTSFTVRLLLGEKVISRSFEAVPSKTRVGIGMLSVGAILQQGGDLSGTVGSEGRVHGYLETPIGDGKLYVAASGAVTGQGTTFTRDLGVQLPTTTNPLERYSNYGDSSSEQIPLQGLDPIAARYEHPAFNVQYRQSAVPVDVFNVGVTPTALSGFTRSNPQVSGFAALLPADLITKTFAANGTRILTLGSSDLQPDSETVELVTLDRLTGAEQIQTLRRLTDYTLDPAAGVLSFQRPMNLVDERGNEVRVRVSYRLNDPLGERQLAWGVQVASRLGDNLKVGAAVVQMDSVTSVGARAQYDDGTSRADVLAAYAGSGLLLNGTASAQTDHFSASGSFRLQGDGYTGLNSVKPGLAVAADATYKLSDHFGVNARGTYHREADTNNDPSDDVSGGYADLRGLYTFAPFTLGAGIRAGVGDQQGFGVVGSVGYTRGGTSLTLDHAQGISGDLATVTTLKASVPVAENVTAEALDVYTWGTGHRASVGLKAKLGMTNLAVNYDLPTADGAGNRARFGADTALPLSDKLSLGLNGSYVMDWAGDEDAWNAGASLRFKEERLSATLGGDLSDVGDGGVRAVLKGGAAYSLNDELTLSADGTRVFAATAAESGSAFAVSGALRASQWQGLAYLRYKGGVLAGGKPEVIAEANLEYHVPKYAVRGGLAARSLLDTPGSLTYQASASGTYYVTDRLGLGLAARALVQPATNVSAVSLGLEASYRVLPGTWVTAGYNPMGFQGIGTNIYTRQGAYLRLDLMLDDGQPNGVLVGSESPATTPEGLTLADPYSAPVVPALPGER